MLDHDHRVAEIAQALEGLEQALVVALVQPDRGLVQDVEHAGEARADLRGEPDALALAAGQAAGIAGERQVAEADVAQEAEPVVDLLEDAPRDLLVLGGKMRGQVREPCRGGVDREVGDLADVAAVDLDRERLGLQAIAAAGLARRAAEIACRAPP